MMTLTRLGMPFAVSFGVVAATTGLYLANVWIKRKSVDRAASLLFLATLAVLTWVIAERYIAAGRPPFKTLFESLVLFGWSVAIVYVAVERFYRLALLGALTSVFVLGIMTYAVLKRDVDIISLPAALQSGWFVPHVVVYFVGYAALFLGAALAVIYLIRPQATVTFTNLRGTKVVPYAHLMHTVVKFGFVLISVGLVIGALWAKSAWGDYWVWDPKENWSLITWLMYIIYLHVRTSPGWKEKHSAWLLIGGFAAVIFTYLGMNMLPTADQSAHVYQ
jgi:cytochrome c-type biogenesis protein CcsB